MLDMPLTEYALSDERDDTITSYYEYDGYSYLVRTETADIQSITNMRNEYRNLKFRPNDVWLDLGACIGGFAVPCSNICKQVICVEPSPANLTFLQENLYYNNSDVTKYAVLPFAVTDINSDVVTLYLDQETNTQYHTVVNKRKRKGITVRNVNFDALVYAFNPDCVKMDIEGAELDVIMESDILGILDEIYIEYHRQFLGGNKLEKDANLNRFRDYLNSMYKHVESHGRWMPTFHCSNR